MAAVDRLAVQLRTAGAEDRALLVLYLTYAPDCSPVELALAAIEAGADILELGIPTPSARPRGAEMRGSYERARGSSTEEAWEVFHQVREAAPQTPLLPLVYPETVADLGWDAMLNEAAAAGADGVVLTRPWHDDGLEKVASSGLSAVPVIPVSAGPAEVARAEASAAHLTYRALLDRTGDQLELGSAQRLARGLASTATKPFLVGFGVSSAREVSALAPHAAGVVVGSELIRVIRTSAVGDRPKALAAAVRSWKSAAGAPRAKEL
ncbi:Tryptophan synthase alpha chain (plasmid) [Streptomyces sp. ADI95-16]|uniref:tryptophan synthase subunit alpha n=1 Tax=unclassified Streptomyces TaxID=2593676 RepID=UPI000F3A848E|nr:MULTISPECIES: tryptophan synthase subunit alpha [unclassified Streptomyces]AYV33075.1 Tryptophan synthase alpha chain [Streptomyces sp. ADI95-16]RPK24628.1 Tryptophan synthase alpha chain [Streptomyces sp. ADI91-18]